MSDTSPNLSLPYIQPSQAQKHVTHNEGMQILDALTQLSVTSATLKTPPAAPAAGGRWIVGTGATGIWTGKDDALAVWQNGAWAFYAPAAGWTAWDRATARHLTWTGTSWAAAATATGETGEVSHQNLDLVGVNATADAGNRLTVASAAALFTHDGSDVRLKLNKAGAGDTGSLLFQTGFAGRAEIGLSGSDDFSVKVSDGGAFAPALIARAGDGRVELPAGAVAGQGADPALLVSRASVQALAATGLGTVGTAVPAGLTLDRVVTGDQAASLSFAGRYPGRIDGAETIPVDPTRAWRLSVLLRQEAAAGDWSGFADGDRHAQAVGLLFLDADGLQIAPQMHMRHREGGVDSRTVLAAPLAPGDTAIRVADAAGWNDSDPDASRRGVVIFGYRDSAGRAYDDYSRIVATDLFALSGVDKAANRIALNAPLPAAMGNPRDAGGVWPAGTVIANSAGGAHKQAVADEVVLPATGRWYRATAFIGGIDRSGTNAPGNFVPGTAMVRPFWRPNFSNRTGGFGTFPDTGAAQRVWFAGLSVLPEPHAALSVSTAPGEEGRRDLQVVAADPGAGTLALVPAAPSLEPL